jgi:hypothetical protein
VRIRVLAPALAVVALIAACGDADDPATTDGSATAESEADPEVDDPTAAPETDDLLTEEPQPELDPQQTFDELGIEVGDTQARGVGVVLPLPAGWELDPGPATQGALFSTSGEAEPEQLLLGVAGIEDDPFSGFEGASFDEALEVIRGSVPQEPDRDEAVELAGARSAQVLEYEQIPGGEEGGPDSYQAVLLAEDADGTLALFNYVALSGSEDRDFIDRLIDEAGFDPDSEPLPPIDLETDQ